MTDAFYFLQTVAREAEPIGWKPQSWLTVIALVTGVLSLLGIVFGYGRWVEKLNGQAKRFDERFDRGEKRVTAVEQEQERAATERAQFHIEITRILDTQTRVLEAMGEHKNSVTVCREDTEKLGIDLGAKIHEQTLAVHAMDKNLSGRLVAVETILKERGIGRA